MTNGASLIGQMLKILIRGGEPPLWISTAMEDLIVEDGRVVGARISRNGATVNVQARKGVLLAAGGFSRNADMRRRFSGDQPNDGKWSIANAGDTGEVLQTAMELGAKTDLLDEAWWLPMVFIADPGAASLGSGRQRPGAIYIDGAGRRFCNESNSYVEVGKAMYANKAVPCWQVFDEGYVGRYVSGANPLKKRTLSEDLITQGAVKRADTIADLARQIDVPADALEETVKRFNEFAAQGLDPDFGRGQSAYNVCLGDPGYRPNAALGPLDQGAVLRHPGIPGRRRDLRGTDHQRARPGPRRPGPGHRRSVCDGKHHRHRDGPQLSGCGRQHRQYDDLRIRGRPSRRRQVIILASRRKPAYLPSELGRFTSARREKLSRRR